MFFCFRCQFDLFLSIRVSSDLFWDPYGALWASFGSHPGAIWTPFGNHLGAFSEIWDHVGSHSDFYWIWDRLGIYLGTSFGDHSASWGSLVVAWWFKVASFLLWCFLYGDKDVQWVSQCASRTVNSVSTWVFTCCEIVWFLCSSGFERLVAHFEQPLLFNLYCRSAEE